MKLVISIVNNRDKGRLGDALLEDRFDFTIIGSTGGFLKQGNTTFLIGVQAERIEHLLHLLETHCQAREEVVSPVPLEGSMAGVFIQPSMTVRIGGATVFIIDVERFERF